jgi:hypothetical protein
MNPTGNADDCTVGANRLERHRGKESFLKSQYLWFRADIHEPFFLKAP